MVQITEVAPDVFRITTFVEPANLQFSQFLVRDEEPLLFHTGLRALFPAVKDAVASLVDPRTLRWIGFSHFEADECGSLPEVAGAGAAGGGRERRVWSVGERCGAAGEAGAGRRVLERHARVRLS